MVKCGHLLVLDLNWQMSMTSCETTLSLIEIVNNILFNNICIYITCIQKIYSALLPATFLIPEELLLCLSYFMWSPQWWQISLFLREIFTLSSYCWTQTTPKLQSILLIMRSSTKSSSCTTQKTFTFDLTLFAFFFRLSSSGRFIRIIDLISTSYSISTPIWRHRE